VERQASDALTKRYHRESRIFNHNISPTKPRLALGRPWGRVARLVFPSASKSHQGSRRFFLPRSRTWPNPIKVYTLFRSLRETEENLGKLGLILAAYEVYSEFSDRFWDGHSGDGRVMSRDERFQATVKRIHGRRKTLSISLFGFY